MIQEAEECSSSSRPEFVRSSYPQQQPQLHQQQPEPLQQNQQPLGNNNKECIDFHCQNNNSMQDLFQSLFFNNELPEFHPEKINSSVVEFDRKFVDIDLE